MGMPMLVGAGVGALGSALTGGSPFKGALLGGATGGLTGGASSLLSGGNFLEGALGTAAKNAAGSAASSLTPTTTAGFESSMGLPSSAFYEAGGTGMTGLNTAASSGMIPTASGTLINPEYYSSALGTPTYTGGEGFLSNAMGNIGSAIPQSLKDYATPQNMMGVANLMSQQPKQPLPVAPSGGINRGGYQAPSTNLLNVELIPRRRLG